MLPQSQTTVPISSPEQFCESALHRLNDLLHQNLKHYDNHNDNNDDNNDDDDDDDDEFFRLLVGVCGGPGSGKSTLSESLRQAAESSGLSAVVVPMDGYHLANEELRRLGRANRKGAPDTFDVNGFANLLRRIRNEHTSTIWAPVFHREIEESYAGELAVLPEHRLVIVEGIHLLQTNHGWDQVLPLLDATWFLECQDIGEQTRRLVERNIVYGRDPQQANDWVSTVDLPNLQLVNATKHRAHTIFQVEDW